MTKAQVPTPPTPPPKEDGKTKSEDVDDEPDEWDQRIEDTGCARENAKLTDCYYEKKDWRQCTAEMTAFRECWQRQGNDARTSTVQNPGQ